jgi:hypothetical protein
MAAAAAVPTVAFEKNKHLVKFFNTERSAIKRSKGIRLWLLSGTSFATHTYTHTYARKKPAQKQHTR